MVIKINVKEIGKEGYNICIYQGYDPKEYANTLAGINERGAVVDKFTKEFISEHAPEEALFYVDRKINILRGFGDAARKAGDNETADYVSALIRKLVFEKMEDWSGLETDTKR